MAARFKATIHRRDGAWLAGIAAVGLLGLAVFTCIVRAEAVGDGYALARCEGQLRSVERRVRAVNSDVLKRFAGFAELASLGIDITTTDIKY